MVISNFEFKLQLLLITTTAEGHRTNGQGRIYALQPTQVVFKFIYKARAHVFSYIQRSIMAQ
jgi:hypothetical protein